MLTPTKCQKKRDCQNKDNSNKCSKASSTALASAASSQMNKTLLRSSDFQNGEREIGRCFLSEVPSYVPTPWNLSISPNNPCPILSNEIPTRKQWHPIHLLGNAHI